MMQMRTEFAPWLSLRDEESSSGMDLPLLHINRAQLGLGTGEHWKHWEHPGVPQEKLEEGHLK